MKHTVPAITVEDAHEIVTQACKADSDNAKRIYYMVSGMIVSSGMK